MPAKIPILAFLIIASCGAPDDPRPEPPRDCHTPEAFSGATPDTIRFAQLSATGEQAARVELMPGDRGHVLHVHPTSPEDVWDDGGSITFVGPGDEVIYAESALCVSDFAEFAWEIPDDAEAVLLSMPVTPASATLLFTVEITAAHGAL